MISPWKGKKTLINVKEKENIGNKCLGDGFKISMHDVDVA